MIFTFLLGSWPAVQSALFGLKATAAETNWTEVLDHFGPMAVTSVFYSANGGAFSWPRPSSIARNSCLPKAFGFEQLNDISMTGLTPEFFLNVWHLPLIFGHWCGHDVEIFLSRDVPGPGTVQLGATSLRCLSALKTWEMTWQMLQQMLRGKWNGKRPEFWAPLTSSRWSTAWRQLQSATKSSTFKSTNRQNDSQKLPWWKLVQLCLYVSPLFLNQVLEGRCWEQRPTMQIDKMQKVLAVTIK